MNLESIKNGLTNKFGMTGLYLRKHSPEILLGAGLVGMVATVYLAVKAAKKDEVVADHKDNMESVEHIIASSNLSKKEAVQARAAVYVNTGLEFSKLYGPAIGVGALSLTAILYSHGIMTQRQTSLVAAYGLMAKAYEAYRDRVREELGEEKDMAFHLGLREEDEESGSEIHVNEDGTIEVRKTKKKKTKKPNLVPKGTMPSVYARCFDNSNILYKSDRTMNQIYLAAQERYLNDLLIWRGYVFLNEAYDRLGFPATPEGQLVGWVLKTPEEMEEEHRDGYISFGLDRDPASREFMRGENDAIWLDFNVDGIVYNLI